MPQIVISDSLSAFVVAAAALLVNCLRSVSLPRLWNIIIACIGFVLLTAFTLWQAVGFVRDLRTDIILLILLGAVLAGHQLYILYLYIQQVSSPLTIFLPADQRATKRLPAIRRASLPPAQQRPNRPAIAPAPPAQPKPGDDHQQVL